MNEDRYRTLSGEGHGQLREKASRFMAVAFPIKDEKDFKERLSLIAREHHASRHVCYAWVLGTSGERYRANDAGEPSGTAGRPILNRIRSAGLTDCAVVVVRYFGGTLLGKAGLVKAYGDAASTALAASPAKEVMILDRVRLTCGLSRSEAIRNTVLAMGGQVQEAHFSDMCRMTVALPRGMVDGQLGSWLAQGIEAFRIDHVK